MIDGEREGWPGVPPSTQSNRTTRAHHVMFENTSLVIRKPLGADLTACHMMLPATIGYAFPCEYRLAVDTAASTSVGAIGFADTGTHLHVLQFHTVLNRRGSGIGTQLINAVVAEAVRRGRHGVVATVEMQAGGAVHQFLERRGFTIGRLYCTAEGDLREIYGRQCQRCTRITGINGGTWQIVPLGTDMYEDAGQLITEYLGSLGAAERGVCHFPDLKRYELSQALIVDGVLQGLILMTAVEDAAVWRLRVVRPQFRNTRASAALLMTTAKISVNTGARRLAFCYYDFADDTAAFVRRQGMRVISTLGTFVKTAAA